MDIFVREAGIGNSSSFSTLGLIDDYDSFVWTEHYRGEGNFMLKVPHTQRNADILKTRRFLEIDDSYRTMRIHKRETGIDKTGPYIKVEGPSLDYLLSDRLVNGIAQRARSNTGASVNNNWFIQATNRAQAVSRLIGRLLDPNSSIKYGHDSQRIAKFVSGFFPPFNQTNFSLYPKHEDDGTGNFRYYIKPSEIKETIDDILGGLNIGYAFLRRVVNGSDGFHFVMFHGVDRSSQVKLTQDLDTIATVRTIYDVSNYKVALDITTTGVYSHTVGSTTTTLRPYSAIYYSDHQPPMDWRKMYITPNLWDEFDRRYGIYSVENGSYASAKDSLIEAGGTGMSVGDMLRELYGSDYAKEHETEFLTDGVVENESRYQYQKDYGLTDLVSIRSADGMDHKARVVANTISVERGRGVLNYPTLEYWPEDN